MCSDEQRSTIWFGGGTSIELCLYIGDSEVRSSTGSYRDARPATSFFFSSAARKGMITGGSLMCLVRGVESSQKSRLDLETLRKS